MHYRMNNSNDYGHLRVRSNIVRLRGSQILSRVYLFYTLPIIQKKNSMFLTLIVRGSQLHIWVRGGLIQPPPGKCSINGPNELKFCVWPHMGCVWEIPWPKRYNHVSGSRLSPRSKNPKISGILKFGYIFHFFRTELTSKNPKTLPIEFLVKKWSILM